MTCVVHRDFSDKLKSPSAHPCNAVWATAWLSAFTQAWELKSRDSGGPLLGAYKKQRTLELGRAKHHLTEGSALSLTILRSETEASRSRKSLTKSKGPGLTEGLQWKPSATSLPATFQKENKVPTEARENECPSPTISQGLWDSQPQSLSIWRGASWRHSLRNPNYHRTKHNTMNAPVLGSCACFLRKLLAWQDFPLAFPRSPITHWAK